MDTLTELTVRKFSDSIKSRYDVAGMILFGSRARQAHGFDSDADVAVLLKSQNKKSLTIKLEMADIAFDIMLETGILVSPLPINIHQWENPSSSGNPQLLKNIRKEGILF